VFGENIPVPLEVHVPDPVEDVPVSTTVELFAHTVGFAPGVTVPGRVTVTFTVMVGPGHPATVANKVYVPELDGVALAMLGFCTLELKPLGPLQL
jgi:hypothetical protein